MPIRVHRKMNTTSSQGRTARDITPEVTACWLDPKACQCYSRLTAVKDFNVLMFQLLQPQTLRYPVLSYFPRTRLDCQSVGHSTDLLTSWQRMLYESALHAGWAFLSALYRGARQP